MGFYINPPDFQKRAWLRAHGAIRSADDCRLAYTDPKLHEFVPVVLVDNGAFDTAGIAYDVGEFDSFTLPRDHRPKEFYLIPREYVVAMCPAVEQVLF